MTARRPRTPARSPARSLARSLARPLGLVLVLPLALAGCVEVPVAGPVQEIDSAQQSVRADGVPAIDPQPPVGGASPTEIVRGFLDALQASPVSTTIAGRYLTASARSAWRPERSTIVYDDRSDPLDASGATSAVAVRLVGAERFDARGRWRGAVSSAASLLRFRVVVEGGEYRIDDPPDALVVSRTWFTARYTPASLYYVAPTGRALVPEPVYAPSGPGRAGALVRALLAGPPADVRGVERSALPSDLRLALSVPVDSDGRAVVSLRGRLGDPEPEEASLMLAQIGWTLRQDPAVSSVAVTVDGEPLRDAQGRDAVPVSELGALDPSRTGPDPTLYGVRAGRLVARRGDELLPVDGPLGRAPGRLASVAVDASGSQAAGVTADGRRLLVGPVSLGSDVGVRVVGRGSALLRPGWDAAGRLWTADAATGRLLVATSGATAGVLRPVVTLGARTPAGLPAGTRLRRLLVSPDGTRLVLLTGERVGARTVDRVRVARILLSPGGRVLGVRPAVALPASSLAVATSALAAGTGGAGPRLTTGDPAGVPGDRLLDVAWSLDGLAVLVGEGGGAAAVLQVGVDGSPIGSRTPTTVTGATGLVGSSAPGRLRYAAVGDELVGLDGGGPTPRLSVSGVSSLGYAG
ncbi:LpqB family beta-propeller domain-containing protein [Nocardioides sp. TRM66260-LWL]|uniref:LpqB family beta-propeller domain-containing protein n=1 Tax=Nocardioides sp. TRM66260-LWL TaxID=2874478 RepID=UPI001CC6CACE|nr:LpqB family beta-propeller domain-containing protein [Nocardioides sp. TRM66260-LWL]MBZ5734202.1 LpqB family beta-propeller domain-containing protein [Nocardioides sp. TRM66260-LWL]